MLATADHSDLIGQMIADFRKVVRSMEGELTEPSERDRIAFELNQADWAQSLRRLGLGAADETKEAK